LHKITEVLLWNSILRRTTSLCSVPHTENIGVMAITRTVKLIQARITCCFFDWFQLVSSPQGLLTLAGPLIDDGSSKSVATPGGLKPKRDADLALLKL